MMVSILRFSTVLLVLFAFAANAQVVKTELKQINGQWTFVRDGNPYYVKGAGGKTYIDELKKCGGNSIRTWSLDDAEEILDMAHENGLTVMMGLWVGHERHGFDYNDDVAVKRQFERFKAAIPKIKDHPALLCWGVGNEVDLFYSNTKVWYAVEEISKMIQEVDGNHPITTVTAGLDSTEVQLIKERCPSIDFYGVNTYGEIGMVPESLVKWGWKGPFMITEWGPTGHWEVTKTKWGAPYEQSSKEKAEIYENRYNNYIKAYRNRCVGSYVFLWGQKQETTSTWYGLFTADGDWTSTLDKLQIAWTGQQPKNLAPNLNSFTIEGAPKGTKNIILQSNQRYTAQVDIDDPDGEKLKYKWQILPESTDIKAGGDKESAPPPVLGLYGKKKGGSFLFEAPKEEGAYRLFVFAYDEGGKVAYANYPFFVEPSNEPAEKPIRVKKQKLEL
ncbi:MAG: glycoside hydrolase family 2 TIM barrel-domain containing protein [Bacteroidia bacterium]